MNVMMLLEMAASGFPERVAVVNEAAKLTYAAIGGVTGGLTYALTLGNTEAAEKVWVASGGGDYVLAPEHVSGQRRVHFTGGGTGQAPAQPEF